MASLNFPPTTPDVPGPEYTLNGVVYYWDGQKWTANTEEGFTGVFVDVTGDNMTGDLTLGTDKITLNATDGSAEFAGKNIVISSHSSGNSYVYTYPANSNNPDAAFGVYDSVNTKDLARINNDGSAKFAGAIEPRNIITVNTLSDTIPNLPAFEACDSQAQRDAGERSVTISSTGSATFAGDVTSGGSPLLGANQGAMLANAGAVIATRTESGSQVFIGFTEGDSTATSTIYADGRAKFAGDVQVGPTPSTTAKLGVQTNSTGWTGFLRNANTSGGGLLIETAGEDSATTAFKVRPNGGTDKVVISANGSATFAGDIQSGADPRSGAAQGSYLGATGYVNATRNGTLAVWSGYQTGLNTPTSQILASGRAEFTGGVKANNQISVERNITDSSAFAVFDISGGPASASNRTVQINTNGSAEFANKMRIHSEGTVSTARGMTIGDVNGNTANPTRFYIDNSALASSPGTHVLRWNSATGQVTVDATLPFDNNITAGNVTFNLEPENDTYYTATTDAEGNETRVYNGPTLDVKAVIQDLQQRVNDRDAVIADLTTRIQTLEGGNN